MRAAEIIKRETASFYKLTRKEMEGPCRALRIAHPRMVAMTLSRHYTRDSLPKIGRTYGDRDHTTVLHGIRRTAARAADLPDVAFEIAIICYRIEIEIAALQRRQAQLIEPLLASANKRPVALLPAPPKPPKPPKRIDRWTTFDRRVLVPA